MFERTSPSKKVGDVGGISQPASMRMVKDAIRYYPGAVIGTSLRNSARQFVTFCTGGHRS